MGKDLPVKDFAEFQDLKYNDSEEWTELKGIYRYLKENSESEKAYYIINKDIQKLVSEGIITDKIGTAVKPLPIEFNSVHKHALKRMRERNITEDNAKSYISKAKIMFKQNGGEKNTYYSEDGAASVVVETKLLVTCFPKEKYDDGAKAIMEVLKKHGK